MHDPQTLVYGNSLIQIWHKDPCRDGSDDSCGWFKRPRHGNPEHFRKIISEIDFHWKHWFSPTGDPLMSTPGIVLEMFHLAAWIHFGRNHRKSRRFINLHVADILSFAENSTDSMHGLITNRYNEKRDDRVKSAAGCVYGCLLRWEQSWYQHARWHIHHWRINFPILSRIKHRFFLRCTDCRRPFQWNGGDRVWAGNTYLHSDCLTQRVRNTERTLT